MKPAAEPPRAASRRERLYEIIFEADTPLGKGFDVTLIVLIALSVIVVTLDSVRTIRDDYGTVLIVSEWIFTGIFSIEYALRLACTRQPVRYALSFFGLVDLLAILPTYVSIFVPGSQYLTVIRILRVLRVFRVLKLAHHVREAKVLREAIWASRRKIQVFVYAVLTLVVVLGSLMYLIEGETNGFTSIPRSMYWAIVTLTTVGFGDITPQTEVGQTLAAFIMILGYGCIAVPTGIVTAEMTQARRSNVSTQVCPGCLKEGHDTDAQFCKWCGAKI